MKKRTLNTVESAFSLMEVTIALAIAAVAVVSLIGVMSSGTKSATDSADQTAIGNMFEDIEDRISNRVLKVGEIEGSPFFYDLRGSFIDPELEAVADSSLITRRFYRAEINLIKPVVNAGDSTNFEEALAIQVKIFWPIDDKGGPIHPQEPGSEITFLTGAKTGPGWTEVDQTYQPRIEN